MGSVLLYVLVLLSGLLQDHYFVKEYGNECSNTFPDMAYEYRIHCAYIMKKRDNISNFPGHRNSVVFRHDLPGIPHKIP